MTIGNAVNDAAADLGKEVLRSAAPELLTRYDAVKRVALPRDLADVKLGPVDEGLDAAAKILRDIAVGIRGQGCEVYDAATRTAGVAVMRSAIAASLEHLGQEKLMQKVLDVLPDVLECNLERVLPAVAPSPVLTDEQRRILRGCLLRIEDDSHISSGFVVSSAGQVITAAHVALRPRKLDIAFVYGESVEERLPAVAEVAELDERTDTAILHIDDGDWRRLSDAGLRLAPLGKDWKPRDLVFCCGYQEQQIALTPRTVGAAIHPWDPRLQISFAAGDCPESTSSQNCLVLTLAPMEAHVVHGMSGGPVLNTRTNEIIGMVTGAEREAWVRSEFKGEAVWVLASPGYGFVVPLGDVERLWTWN